MSATTRRLTIIQGDITLLPLKHGALVNPSNTGLILTSRGVNAQIARRAGPFIQQTLHMARSKIKTARLEPAQVIDTEAGQLPAARLFHVAIVGARKVNKRLITRCLLNVFDLADEYAYSQLAIPPLGVGIGKFALKDFLEMFWRLTTEEFTRLDHLEEIYLCLDDQESFEFAKNYAQEHLEEMPEEVEVVVKEGGINIAQAYPQFA